MFIYLIIVYLMPLLLYERATAIPGLSLLLSGFPHILGSPEFFLDFPGPEQSEKINFCPGN